MSKFVLMCYLTLLVGSVWSQPASACSSCGSGAIDPIILFPNESYKYYIGYSHQYRLRDIGSHGNVRRTPGITNKQIYTTSFATRLGESQAFASLTLPYTENISAKKRRGGLGDPLLTLRYNLMLQNFVEPWMPQVQLVASHKWPGHDSVHNAEDPELLDVFSSGYRESSAGADVWFGMWLIKFGTTALITHSHSTSKNGVRLEPGRRFTGILTMGSVYNGWLKGLMGYIANDSSDNKEAGQSVSNSRRESSSWYLTLETLDLPWGNLRLNFTQQGNSGGRNATSFNSLTFAYMKAWL